MRTSAGSRICNGNSTAAPISIKGLRKRSAISPMFMGSPLALPSCPPRRVPLVSPAAAAAVSTAPFPTTSATAPTPVVQKTVVVIGNGMVGLRFCENLVEKDKDARFKVVTFCEESRPAYHRMNMTQYFTHRDPTQLELTSPGWYADNHVELHVGDKALSIDRERKVVVSERGKEIAYDVVVLATGSNPFVPPIPKVKSTGVFVYRTLQDLDAIIAYSKRCTSVAVLGGGLLGLEAAKAAYDLGVQEVHVVEAAPRLMPRQIDEEGSQMLVKKIEALGLKVHVGAVTETILTDESGAITGMQLKGRDQPLACQMLIVSAGITPRDELARGCGLEVGERGGVVVDSAMRTSDPSIFAIGECALHTHSKYGTMAYGLVAPGYDMAEILAKNFVGEAVGASPGHFAEADLSTKLKLMGVDVANFGETSLSMPADQLVALCEKDDFEGKYKKLFFSKDGKRLLGGILVGDASDFYLLAAMTKADLKVKPRELVYGGGGGPGGASSGPSIIDMPDTMQVCSCNNVSKGTIVAAIRDGRETLAEIKQCTKAGTGCGGCMPMVTDLFNAEMKAQGKAVKRDLCMHFALTRQQLWHVMRVEKITSFDALIAKHGVPGQSKCGCEVCKPAVGSILASMYNEEVLAKEHLKLSDTNDRYLANIQRGGSYSVVPRIPGGEITPDKLIALGMVGKKYNLYTKITGGQRIDMFGANKGDLPDIWEELINAGFETGQAYAKAVRTVKSCVGTAWCRFGQQDSVSFAVKVEERYKGVRAPHKIKFAVSGCVRECAEAQSKDVGYIATENGYNVYVAGNGGAKPRHGDLLCADVDEATALRYTDRFLMFYIRTASPLQRTAPWFEELEGGLEYLKQVIIEDKLGLCAELDREMQFLVDSYFCEWKAVVNDPVKRAQFKQFANSDVQQSGIDFVPERQQMRPAYWPKANGSSILLPTALASTTHDDHAPPAQPMNSWVHVAKASDIPPDAGSTILYGDTQIAVFNFAARGEWYATHNMCPHKRAFSMNQGFLGATADDTPKVACPVHKKTFSLATGKNLQGEDYSIPTFPVKVEGGEVYLLLPPKEQLDEHLSTKKLQVKASETGGCGAGCGCSEGNLAGRQLTPALAK